jgi:hypothetical protein
MEYLGNLWGVLGCGSVRFGTLNQHFSVELAASIFRTEEQEGVQSFFPEHGGSKLLKNVNACLPNYMASRLITL